MKIKSSDPHQVRWFSTEIPPHPRNTARGYPDPVLEVSFNNEEILVTSNGIPTFEFVSATPNGLRGQDFKWAIPCFPEPADELTQIPLLGMVAITTVGLPIYGPNEAQHPPLTPPQIRPSGVFVGNLRLTAIARPNRTSVRGTMRIPIDTEKGKKDVTVVFPGPPGRGEIRFVGEDLFEVE